MTTPTVTSQVSQSLNIHGDFASTVTLNDILFFEHLPDPVYVITIQIITIHGEWKIYFF